MKKLFKYGPLFLMILSCSTLPQCYWDGEDDTLALVPNGIPIEFLPHYTTFYEVTGAWPYGTTAEYATSFPNAPTRLGVCYNSGGLKKSSPSFIRIRQDWWQNASLLSREALILHELGHCVLGRGHNDELFPDGREKSLMNSYLLRDRVYGPNREYYLKELGETNE